jgi:hypothetical protein
MFAGTEQIGRESNGPSETLARARKQTARSVAIRALLPAIVICAAAGLRWLHRDLASPGWLDASLLILAMAFTVAGLTRELPVQNAIMAGASVAFMSALVWIIGAKTGIAFGPVLEADRFGSRMIGILSWPIPVLGVVIVLNSRQVARLILRRWPDLSNRGLWTIGLASVLALAIDTALEAYAVGSQKFWVRGSSGTASTWRGVPWYSFFIMPAVTALILVVCVPWLVDKRGTNTRAVNLYPLWLWFAVDLFLNTGNAAHGFWDCVAVGLVIAMVVGALSVRGVSVQES